MVCFDSTWKIHWQLNSRMACAHGCILQPVLDSQSLVLGSAALLGLSYPCFGLSMLHRQWDRGHR